MGFASEDAGWDQKADCEWSRGFRILSLNFVHMLLVSMDDLHIPYSYMLMPQDFLLTTEGRLDVAVVMTM